MYMALEKPKCDRCSFFLPLTQGYLGSYLSAWPGHPRVLSPDTPPSIPLCTNFSLWLGRTTTPNSPWGYTLAGMSQGLQGCWQLESKSLHWG